MCPRLTPKVIRSVRCLSRGKSSSGIRATWSSLTESAPRVTACASSSEGRLLGIADLRAPGLPRPEYLAMVARILEAGDDQDLADARQHWYKQRVVDHRFKKPDGSRACTANVVASGLLPEPPASMTPVKQMLRRCFIDWSSILFGASRFGRAHECYSIRVSPRSSARSSGSRAQCRSPRITDVHLIVGFHIGPLAVSGRSRSNRPPMFRIRRERTEPACPARAATSG